MISRKDDVLFCLQHRGLIYHRREVSARKAKYKYTYCTLYGNSGAPAWIIRLTINRDTQYSLTQSETSQSKCGKHVNHLLFSIAATVLALSSACAFTKAWYSSSAFCFSSCLCMVPCELNSCHHFWASCLAMACPNSVNCFSSAVNSSCRTRLWLFSVCISACFLTVPSAKRSGRQGLRWIGESRICDSLFSLCSAHGAWFLCEKLVLDWYWDISVNLTKSLWLCWTGVAPFLMLVSICKHHAH